MNSKSTKELEVVIDGDLEELTRAIGHTKEGDEVWVNGALPGERVRAKIVHRSKIGRYFANATKILDASENRVEVPCKHFLDCGGCDFLHANLETQHRFKRHAVAEALEVPLESVDEVVSSPEVFGYRALAKFVVGDGKNLGSYRPRSHEVVDMRDCVVHTPAIERVADVVRASLTPNLQLRYVIVRASLKQAQLMVTLVVRRDVGRLLNKLVDRLSQLSDVARIVMNVNDGEADALLAPGADLVVYDGSAVVETVGGLEQKLNSGAFSQINPGAAAKLYETIVNLSQAKNLSVLDLYCGSGGISRALLSADAAKVHGVETNLASIQAAKSSSTSDRLTYQAASVEEVLHDFGSYDIIVVNPPRKGLSLLVVDALSRLPKLKLIYVSCNPKSLARDINALKSRLSIHLNRVVPVDMFPQTRHVETVVSVSGSH